MIELFFVVWIMQSSVEKTEFKTMPEACEAFRNGTKKDASSFYVLKVTLAEFPSVTKINCRFVPDTKAHWEADPVPGIINIKSLPDSMFYPNIQLNTTEYNLNR